MLSSLIEFLEDECGSAREKTHSPGVGVINVLDIELPKCPDIRMRGYRLFVYTKEAFFLVNSSRDELWSQFFASTLR